MKSVFLSMMTIITAVAGSSADDPVPSVGKVSVYYRSYSLDGLPLGISDVYTFELGEIDEFGTINLVPLFRKLSPDIGEFKDGYIRYNAADRRVSAAIWERDDQTTTVKAVEAVIKSLWKHQEKAENIRAFLAELEQMAVEDRVSTVLKIGFYPDSSISSFISRIGKIQGASKYQKESDLPPPFPGNEKAKLSREDQKRLTKMKETLAALLETSLTGLKANLRNLDHHRNEKIEQGEAP